MPIVLYGMEFSPPCLAVLVTAKAVGVQLDFKVIDPTKGEQLTESFRKINPAHTIPTLDDNGLRIWESRAIMGYLVQQYGKDDKLYPKEPKQRARVDNMLYFDAASLYSSFANYFYPHIMEKKPYDPVAGEKMKERLGVLDLILSQESFIAGGNKPSLADISIRCSLFTPNAAGFIFDEASYPNIVKWMARFEVAIPFFKEFTAKPYETLHDFLQSHMPVDTAVE